MDNKQKHEALTRQVRACKNDNPYALKHLHTILTKYLDSTALVAVDVAQESGDPIGKVLAASLKQSNNAGLLIDIYERLPTNSVALMEVNLIIAQRMVEMAEEKADESTDFVLAEVMASYAEALADAGDYQQGLLYAQKSVCLYQRATDKKDRWIQQGEVNSQTIFARCLMSMGQMDDAILLQETIIAFYQTTPLADNDSKIAYANSLLILSSYWRVQEAYPRAIDYGKQALAMVQDFPTTESRYRYIQHRISRNLADCYDSTNELDRASLLLEDAFALATDLANDSHDQYELELIDTLESLASVESRRGNLEKAQGYAEQAFHCMGKHYQERQQAFASSYSSLLINLSLVELAAGELLSSQQKMDQAVILLESLLKQYPKRFSLHLAAVLNNRVEVLLALNAYDAAIADAKRCLLLYRSHPDQDANSAMALNTLTNAFMQAGDLENAQPTMQECIQIYQQLMTVNTDYCTDLAMTLGTLALIKEQMAAYQAGLAIADSALDYWEQGQPSAILANPQGYHKVLKVRLSCLIELERYTEAMAWSQQVLQHLEDNPHLSLQTQADTFSLQSNLLYLKGLYPEAEEMAGRGITLLRQLPLESIPSYKVDLADSLGNLCFLQAERDQVLALETAKEAAQLYQQLPEENFTVPMLSNTAIILQNLGSMAQACEQYDLARDSFQKAVFYQQQIIDVDEEYRYEFTTLLQLLLNLQIIMEDTEFYSTLAQLRQILDQLPADEEIEALRQRLIAVENSFKKNQKGSIYD